MIPKEYIENLERKCPAFKTAHIFHDAAFPYIGKPALGFFAYLGVLVQHKYFTSNMTNETETWKSLIRLLLSYCVVWVFLKQLEFVTWDANIVALYFNKTFIPCGGAAFVLCSLGDSVFEQIGLLNREYGKKYCVYIHEDEDGLSNSLNDS